MVATYVYINFFLFPLEFPGNKEGANPLALKTRSLITGPSNGTFICTVAHI